MYTCSVDGCCPNFRGPNSSEGHEVSCAQSQQVTESYGLPITCSTLVPPDGLNGGLGMAAETWHSENLCPLAALAMQ